MTEINKLLPDWPFVTRQLKITQLISAGVVCIAFAASEWIPMQDWFDGSAGIIRAWTYVAIMYLVFVPVMSIKIINALVGHAPPAHALPERIVLTLFCGIMAFGLISAPISLLYFGGAAAGRANLAFKILTTSAIGLSIVGGLFFFVAALGVWVVLRAIPSFWNNSKELG